MNKEYISLKLNSAGIEHNYSWLGKFDGCYLRARIGKTDKAIVSLIPIDDKSDEEFVNFIIKEIKSNLPIRIKLMKRINC